MQVTANNAAIQASPDIKPEAANPSNSPEQKLAENREVRTRVPLSAARQRLTTPDIPGYHVHWINDYPGRVAAAVQGGYQFVEQSEALITMPDLAGTPVGTGTDLGTRVSIVVGRTQEGGPLRAYLMKIKEEWFKEDQRDGQAKVDAVHEALRHGAQRNPSDNPDDADKRYVKRVSMSSTYSRKPG